MSLTNNQIEAKNFKNFYDRIKPFLNGEAHTGFTPVGTIISVMGTRAPEFYLKCDGAIYNIADYPVLSEHIKNNFGSYDYFGGDGTTTFAVPDLRGEFLRGSGINSHENQGSGADVGEHQNATENLYIQGNDSDLFLRYNGGNAIPLNIDSDITTTVNNYIGGTNKGSYSTTEKVYYTSRPTNTSVLYCIAYQDIYIELNDDRPIQASLDRWLRFDPSNRKGLIIKAGTSILKSDKTYKTFLYDKKVDFTDTITASDNGKDFFVYLMDDDSVIASSIKMTVGVEIGRFHTLCADAGSNLTMIAPASPSSGLSVGNNYLVKSYRADEDPDFYLFYNKTITAITVQTGYDLVTCEHPLSGYVAGDILPESIFCKTFYPKCLVDDAMVYDVDTDICVDIYLQSGTGFNTRSAYNQTHTVSRQPINYAEDMRMVGKRLLYDNEFTSTALGSNEKTTITGSSDKTTVGGHVDSANRRMISAIGCEECCGYIWQWLKDVAPDGGSSWATTDGKASFGQEWGDPYVLRAGGCWDDSSYCGSRSRASNNGRSAVRVSIGSRGCTKIIRSANAPKNSLVPQQINYSESEQIVGTWIDGKPLYQKSIALTYSGNGKTVIDVCDIPENMDRAVNAFASSLANNGGNKDFILYGLSSIRTNGSKIVIAGSNLSADNVSDIVCTIQYTKTTD